MVRARITGAVRLVAVTRGGTCSCIQRSVECSVSLTPHERFFRVSYISIVKEGSSKPRRDEVYKCTSKNRMKDRRKTDPKDVVTSVVRYGAWDHPDNPERLRKVLKHHEWFTGSEAERDARRDDWDRRFPSRRPRSRRHGDRYGTVTGTRGRYGGHATTAVPGTYF